MATVDQALPGLLDRSHRTRAFSPFVRRPIRSLCQTLQGPGILSGQMASNQIRTAHVFYGNALDIHYQS